MQHSAQPGEASETPDLSVSVVTYNSAHCLDAFFESLSAQRGVRWELFVVDNASTDGTPDMLRRQMQGNVTLNQRNTGYGCAHNQNRERFRGRHVLFLNPDVTFAPGVFAALAGFLDANPRAGVAGPKVLEGPERAPFLPRRFYPGEGMVALDRGLRRRDYGWIGGCCLAIRRQVLEEIGGFDRDYFLYSEDTDLCLRVRRAGYRIGWCPEVEVVHQGRQSQTRLSEYAMARNLFSGVAIFLGKHYAERDVRSMLRFQLLAARVVLALPEGLLRVPGRGAAPFRRDRVRARLDACREWLGNRGYRSFPLDGRSYKIAARQMHLLFEWAWKGGFPLDDY